MNMGKYCKSKGMSKEEYKNFVSNIKATACAIRATLGYKGGMYYPVTDLFKYNANEDIKHFVIQALKKIDIEFIADNTMYRVTN